MRIFTSRLLFPFIISIAVTSGLNAAEPWDVPFNSDTAATLKAANAVTVEDQQPIVVLLEDHRFTIENDGRVRGTTRKVYKVLREDAVEVWSSVEQQYQPWRSRKPAIRARVIAKSGSVHQLDPKTIAEAPVTEFDQNTYSDARELRVPLPAVAAGSIVEYEVGMDESPAFAEAGITQRVEIFDTVPIQRFHLSIDSPTEAAVRMASGQIADSAIHRAQDKRLSHLDFDLGPFKARKHVEYKRPFDASPWPWFAFTTARSWQSIAAKYSDLVDKQIEAADLKPLMSTSAAGADALAQIAQLASQLHRNIRYTGVEFSEASIVPVRPSDVLQRRFGDCKDKSALLVAMLRAAGFNANVALLLSGFGPDVDKDLPGIDLFDHAIVHVDMPQHPLWIDATASDLRIGDLPFADQGRLALIASRNTSAPVTIPEQTDTWERHTYEVHFRDFGPGSITETMEAHGPAEGMFRSSYASGDDPKTALEKYVKSSYAAKQLGKFEVSGGDDLGVPVRVSVEAAQTPQVMTTAEVAQINLGPERVLAKLPYGMRQTEDEDEPADEKTPPRTSDFILPSPGALVHVYKLFPPSQYKIANLPKPSKVALGPLTLSKDYRQVSEGEVDVEYRLEIPKRRITAEEYEKIRASIKEIAKQPAETMNFAPATAELLAIGQYSKAIAMVRDDVAKKADDATAHIRFSRLLVTCGLGGPARAEALKATELDPRSSQAWQALAWAWQNDTFGRLREGDWNRAEAIKALRKAMELDPDDVVAATDLAILLEFNDLGERYGRGADLAGALEIYRDVMKKRNLPNLELNITPDLFYSGKYDQAREESTRSSEAQKIAFNGAAIAIEQGVARGILHIQTAAVQPSDRTQLLVTAGILMAHLRRYEDATAMMQAAQRIANNPQLGSLVQMLSRTKKYEDAMAPATDPRHAVHAILGLVLADKIDAASVKSLVSSRAKVNEADFAKDAGEVRNGLATIRRQLSSVGFTAENLIDIAFTQMALEKTGDDTRGYKITSSGGSFPTMYVVKEGDGYKILGSADSAEDVGSLVLDLLKQDKTADAQWWLDQIVPDLKSEKSGWLPAAHGLWSGLTPETRGPAAIRLAAASLIGRSSKSPEAIRILQDGLKSAKNAIDRAQIEQALCEAFAKSEKWEDVRTTAKQLMTSRTFADAGLEYLMKASEALNDWKGLETISLDQLKISAQDQRALRSLAIARMRSGNAAGADEAIAKLKSSSHSDKADELTSWNQILNGRITEETLASLKSQSANKPLGAVTVTTGNSYLIALASATAGKTDEALDSLKSSVGITDTVELDARAWVVYGDICDQMQFKDAAAESWRKARAAKNESDAAKWSLATLTKAGK